MEKFSIISGCVLALLGVAMGAFGAHAFDGLLIANGYIDVYQTAVKYQFYHALALMFIGILVLQVGEHKLAKISSRLMLIGTVIFSGSLYILSLSSIKWLGAITPIGGVILIISWLFLTMYVFRAKITTNA